MQEHQQHNDRTSADQAFLERAEQLRLQRECFHGLDLRQVSGEFCRRYIYNGRSMWLDDASRRIFQAGLDANTGVFTVATYEQILRNAGNPAVTDNNGETPVRRGDQNRRPVLPARPASAQKPQTQSSVHSSTFELGYFEKRSHERIKYTLPVLLLVDGRVIPGETRDISYSGLQVRTKVPLPAAKGDHIRVRISPVAETGANPGSEAAYRVVRVASLLSDTLLALECIEVASNRTLDYLRQLIVSKSTDNGGKRKKLDIEDALLTSYSLLAERFYMRSSSVIPFFLFKVHSQKPPVRLIFSNPNNEHSLRAFRSSHGYDFSVLARHKFLQLLTTLALREGQADILLGVHQPEPGAPLAAVTNSECGQGDSWYRYLAQHIQTPHFFVFKAVARRIRRPIAVRIMSDLDSLSSQSTDLAERLLQEAEKLVIAGALVDVTAQVQSWDLAPYLAPAQAPEIKPTATPSDTPKLVPEVRPISYIEENRREPRFVSQLHAECEAAGGRFSAKARDISAHGLCLVCDTPPQIRTGEHLRVSFPHIKGGSSFLGLPRAAFRNIVYEVIAVENGNPIALRLKQASGWHGRMFNKAFHRYLDRRKRRLPLELSHLVRSAASRFYSSVFIESTATIPVFIFERPKTKPRFAIKAGVAQSPSYLAGFFEVANGEFDFDVLGEGRRLDKLLQQLRSQRSAEMVLMLRKEKIPGTARFRINNMPLSTLPTTEYLANGGAEVDFCCIKLVACTPMSPPSLEVEQAIERLQDFSSPKTDELKAEFTNLVAIGDLVEITGQLAALQPSPDTDTAD